MELKQRMKLLQQDLILEINPNWTSNEILKLMEEELVEQEENQAQMVKQEAMQSYFKDKNILQVTQ